MTTVRSFLQTLWQRRIAVTLAVVLLLIVVMIAATIYTLNIPQLAADHQQTVILGPTQFAPENPSALRIVVRNSETNAPIADANVAVKLAPKGIGFAQTLYSGKTDKSGTAPVAFTIPTNVSGDQTLVIETDSGAGRDHIERAIKVQRDYKVLVTTDKPLYQPSQVIHLRALALGALDRLPAKDQALEFLVEDPKGNKLYRKTIQTSAYGIASADFTLADTVTSGDYKITASVGDTKSEKTVTVKPYVLPKFKLSAETARGYYLPGDKVNGTIHADYFFGKPVAKGDVTIKGVVYDVARAETVSITGKTDDQGAYAFSFTLPNYFASSGLNKNTADFGLEVSVTDQANHIEQTSLSLPISKDAILIDAVPESGKLVAGVENIVYVMTSLPDGSPLAADLTISNLGITTNTGKYGLAEVRFTPQRGNTSLNITVRDTQGRSAARVDIVCFSLMMSR
jgi:5-hydroxyisourate hydrolase-like protein (transthyretin family)